MKPPLIPLLAALIAVPAAAAAADDTDLRALRDELARLRASYEQRIDQLERRLSVAEEKAAAAAQAADAARLAATPPAAPAPAPVGTNAFNPNVSLILSGLYGHTSQDPAGYRITGFALPAAPLADAAPQRGFGLTESELGISANVDHLFYGAMNLAVHPDNSVSTEEAFIQTTSLPEGLTLKVGRFFSGIGYLNEQHAHTWDFVDAPLVYAAFLGGQFNNDGVQLRWLAPTDTFLEIGAELGRGADYPGTGQDRNGSGASAAFAHLGGDLGDSNSWRTGLSYLTTSPQDRQWDAAHASPAAIDNALVTAATASFSGDSRLWIVDAVWKWAPHGNAYGTNFKLQGEYLRRIENGDLAYVASLGPAGPVVSSMGTYSATQSGWYLQGIYQFTPYWRVGLRAERLDTGSADYGLDNAYLARTDYAPARTALMVDYNPSEFSRIRLQYSADKSLQGVTDNEIFLQYQMSLGAHGAHKF